MSAPMQYLAGEPRVVAHSFRRQHELARVVGLRQALALERMPHRLVCEAGRVLARDNGVAEMEVIAMRLREARDRRVAALRLRHRLQERQRAQLQRVELQRIVPRRHAFPRAYPATAPGPRPEWAAAG